MFRNLKIGRKLVLFGIIFSVPVVVLLSLLVKEGGFKFQVQRVNDGAVARRLPGA